jgi:putative peptidoglycan lipid II flippase
MPDTSRTSARSAVFVSAGILASRIVGFVRQRALSHYLGLSPEADAFNAAFRIPNFLQNLFGEGVLSASFIPVYARLRAQGEDNTAVDVAQATFGLLALVTSLVVLTGIAAAPVLTRLIAPGFEGAQLALTVDLVRILFPGAGLLVMSAWCLGVLNSHRRFFLSYAAPVAWNLAIVAAVLWSGRHADATAIVRAATWGSVAGSALQFGLQVPTVVRLLGGLRPRVGAASDQVREVLRNFGPVFLARGVVQISAFVDTILASLLPIGAVTALQNAQMLYLLPVSLFGMSVSAAELPEMASDMGHAEVGRGLLRRRLDNGLRRIAFLVVPSAVAFLAFGGVLSALLFQTGRFTAADSRYVWGILAGSAVGLLAVTLGRLYSSAYYALRDTVTPLRYATVRVVLTVVLGYLAAIPLPPLLGIEPRWGAAGLSASAGVAGWVEFVLLRRTLNGRIGSTGLDPALVARLWGAALVAAVAGLGLDFALSPSGIFGRAAVTLIPFGGVYLGLTAWSGIPEARGLADQVARVFRPHRGTD